MWKDYKRVIAVDGDIGCMWIGDCEQIRNLLEPLRWKGINYLAEINEAHFLEITMNNSTMTTMPITAATMYQKYVIGDVGDVEDDPVLEPEPPKPERPDRSLINPPIWAWREVSSDWKAFSEVGGVLL